VWGKTFEQGFGPGLTLQVGLLGCPNCMQNGIYVSVINKRNPKGHQSVLLPELINGSQSSFIGAAFAGIRGEDPEEVSEILTRALEGVKQSGLQLTYFTARLNRSQLQRIEEANLTRGHHGLSEEVYEDAERVLDQLEKTTALFTVLDYRLVNDPRAPGGLRIDYLKFSFDVGNKGPRLTRE
jgi:hypothetical protein